MTEDQTLYLTFAVDDPELDEEEKQDIATQLLQQLKKLDEIDSVERGKDLELLEGHRGGMTLMSILTAEVSLENIQKLFNYLRDRLDNKIEITIQLEENKKVEFKGKAYQLPEAQEFTQIIINNLNKS